MENDQTYNTYKIPRFKVDMALYTVLDDIINDENTCTYSNPYKTSFTITFKEYDEFIDMYFANCNLNSINPNACAKIGYFVYSGRVFIIDIPKNKNWLFTATNDTTILKKEKRTEQEAFYINDTGSQWLYRYKNKTTKLVQKSICKN